MRLASAWCRVEYEELMVHLLVYLHYACLVAATVTIVGRREYGHYGLLMGPIVPVHYQLMGACN